VAGNVVEANLRFRASLEFARGGVCVISVSGEADVHAAPELEQRLAECCVSPGLRRVVVDLTEATFLDSVALSVLIAAHRTLKLRGLPLEIACADANIRRLLSITGLDRLFTVRGSLAQLGFEAEERVGDAVSVGERSRNAELQHTWRP
jgi:anti-sigma B factor antagonist